MVAPYLAGQGIVIMLSGLMPGWVGVCLSPAMSH